MNARREDDGTKRTLEELAQLYELEPELREVVTEGRTDAAVIRWFMRQNGSDVTVYAVYDRVKITPSEIRRMGQDDGNRGAVVSAALMFEEATRSYSPPSADVLDRVTFIYDQDDDALTGRETPQAKCLLRSDYTSLEMYCFADKPVDKLLKVSLRASELIKADGVLNDIREGLINVAVLRFVLRDLPRPTALVPGLEKRCSIVSDSLVVDVRRLIGDSVNKKGGPNMAGTTIDEILARHAALIAGLQIDARLIIRGHDYVILLCFYLKSRFGELFKDERHPFKTPAVFGNVLIVCLELVDLTMEKLFVELIRRYGGAALAEGG